MFDAKPNSSWQGPALLLVAVLTAASSSAREAPPTAEACATTVTLTAEGQTPGVQANDTICYRLAADTPGFLVITVTPSDPSAAPPGLRLLHNGTGAETAEKPRVDVIGHGTSHLTLWLRQGAGLFTVAVTPSPDGGAHRLNHRFLAENRLLALVEPGARPPRGRRKRPGDRDSEEGEIDPILLDTSSSPGLRSLRPGIYTLLRGKNYSLVFAPGVPDATPP